MRTDADPHHSEIVTSVLTEAEPCIFWLTFTLAAPPTLTVTPPPPCPATSHPSHLTLPMLYSAQEA